ncbi:hypothetical protein HPB50_026680 [Hyalomma asiaticum]|uniref:Uncharacterized protein n=1 Tax=Hyalomma asiaticum TaxID=266040 RepID=A0ACB7RX71_HYAAI|nr:hypothetical protein HPB50_026680 [Hyalomma asiaticum]
MWSTTLTRLRASLPKYRGSSTQAVKTSGDFPLPDFVERTLALGPKYATEPKKSAPELVSIARRVAKGGPVGERDSIVNEGVRVVSRKKPVVTHLPIRQVPQFMRDNSLCVLPADKTGGFVVLTEDPRSKDKAAFWQSLNTQPEVEKFAFVRVLPTTAFTRIFMVASFSGT